MKTIKAEIKLYQYDELNEKAKEKAFNQEEIFLRENPAEYEDKNGVMLYDNMSEWTQEDIKAYVEECININGYLFFQNGEIAHTRTFTDGHKKAGITEFYFQGITYTI